MVIDEQKIRVLKSFLNAHVIQRSNYSNAPKILRKMNDFTCILLPCLISREFKFAFVLISLHFELFPESGQTLSRGLPRLLFSLSIYTTLFLLSNIIFPACHHDISCAPPMPVPSNL